VLFAFGFVWFVWGFWCCVLFVWVFVTGSTLASLVERGFLTMVPVCAFTKTAAIATMSAAMVQNTT